MSKKIKEELINFEKTAYSLNKIQTSIDELMSLFKEKMLAPFIKESRQAETNIETITSKTSKMVAFLMSLTAILHKIVKMTFFLDKQWEPAEEGPTVSDKEVILEFIRQMHKAGKLDFTY
jgi:hypothetical protein